MTDIPHEIRSYIREELRGVYTCHLGIIQSVDVENRRCEVALKDSKKSIPDNVPIASPYAGDGYGVVYPIEKGDEGLLLVLKDPIDDLLAERGFQEIEKQRQHSIQDAIFFPQVWYDSDTIPEHEPGEYVFAHESGSVIRIKPDGTTLLNHSEETATIRLDKKGVHFQGEPEEEFKNEREKEIIEEREEVYPSELLVPGSSIDGTIEIGKPDAMRVDENRELTEEPVAPIIDPMDKAETEFINPTTVNYRGPVSHGFHETRHFVFERYEKDPKPEDIPFPLEKIPIGYTWINLEEGALKIMGASETPVIVASL